MKIGEIHRALDRVGRGGGTETEEPNGLMPSIGVRKLVVVVIGAGKARVTG